MPWGHVHRQTQRTAPRGCGSRHSPVLQPHSTFRTKEADLWPHCQLWLCHIASPRADGHRGPRHFRSTLTSTDFILTPFPMASYTPPAKNPLIQLTAAHCAPQGVSPTQCFGVRAHALAERQRSSSMAHVDRRSGFPRRPGPLCRPSSTGVAQGARLTDRPPTTPGERVSGPSATTGCFPIDAFLINQEAWGCGTQCAVRAEGGACSSLRPHPRGLLDKGRGRETRGLLHSPLAADLPEDPTSHALSKATPRPVRPPHLAAGRETPPCTTALAVIPRQACQKGGEGRLWGQGQWRPHPKWHVRGAAWL